LFATRRARSIYRRLNPTSPRRNLLICRALTPLFKFIHARARKNRMSVCVNKSRQHHASTSIDHLSTSIDEHADLSLSSNSLNQSITNQQCATRYDRELAQLSSNTRACRSGKSYKLRTVDNSESLTCVF
jgi:hypothetical protein